MIRLLSSVVFVQRYQTSCCEQPLSRDYQETEEEFQELCEVVREIKFERMGVFVFSPEDGTPAADMDDQIDREIAERRRDQLMEIQREISLEQQKSLIGRKLTVLVRC